VRVIGIETSTLRGSVALAESDGPVAAASHEQPNAHAEAILPLLERVLAEAGWPKSSIDRIAVGVGPGSFTGLRVGIALAQGIALGLGRPIVGVGSLCAMARAVPASVAGHRVALLDARRGEVFAAAYAEDGAELAAAAALPRETALAKLARRVAGPRVLVGRVARELAGAESPFASEPTDLPHATWTALIGAELVPGAAAEPLYIRDAGATRPSLPPSPFGT
jgi:tRNA threonylcarbamoyladenosine biosynthesis protein TsaB